MGKRTRECDLKEAGILPTYENSMDTDSLNVAERASNLANMDFEIARCSTQEPDPSARHDSRSWCVCVSRLLVRDPFLTIHASMAAKIEAPGEASVADDIARR